MMNESQTAASDCKYLKGDNMRALEILPEQKLFEMPYLMSGRLNVPLQNDATSLQELTRIKNRNPTMLADDGDGSLYFLLKGNGGEYAYISKQQTPKIEYYMEYETNNIPTLQNSATQIIIWNRLAPVSLTSQVFFGQMLHNFDTMVSDDQQSVDGQRFWLRQMREALRKSFHIGMLDGSQMRSFDPSGDFDMWIKSVDGWGQDSDHWFRRFFITKIAIQQGNP